MARRPAGGRGMIERMKSMRLSWKGHTHTNNIKGANRRNTLEQGGVFITAYSTNFCLRIHTPDTYHAEEMAGFDLAHRRAEGEAQNDWSYKTTDDEFALGLKVVCFFLSYEGQRVALALAWSRNMAVGRSSLALLWCPGHGRFITRHGPRREVHLPE